MSNYCAILPIISVMLLSEPVKYSFLTSILHKGYAFSAELFCILHLSISPLTTLSIYLLIHSNLLHVSPTTIPKGCDNSLLLIFFYIYFPSVLSHWRFCFNLVSSCCAQINVPVILTDTVSTQKRKPAFENLSENMIYRP